MVRAKISLRYRGDGQFEQSDVCLEARQAELQPRVWIGHDDAVRQQVQQLVPQLAPLVRPLGLHGHRGVLLHRQAQAPVVLHVSS